MKYKVTPIIYKWQNQIAEGYMAQQGDEEGIIIMSGDIDLTSDEEIEKSREDGDIWIGDAEWAIDTDGMIVGNGDANKINIELKNNGYDLRVAE